MESGGASGAALWQHSPMPTVDFTGLELRTRPLCQAAIFVDAATSPGALGASPWGHRQAHYIKDGWFEGARLSGVILPGGGDWPRQGADPTGPQALDVRAVWRTHDGALIYLAYTGKIVLPPDVLAEAAAAGGAEGIDPTRYYFRTTPSFETGDARYDWLNGLVCIGIGRAIPDGVAYAIHEVL
jgi:hypothetical protein